MEITKLLKAHQQSAKLLTTKEAADRLGLSNPNTLCVWRTTKRYPELKYVKVGRLIRYRVEDIEAFLANRTVGIDTE